MSNWFSGEITKEIYADIDWILRNLNSEVGCRTAFQKRASQSLYLCFFLKDPK